MVETGHFFGVNHVQMVHSNECYEAIIKFVYVSYIVTQAYARWYAIKFVHTK